MPKPNPKAILRDATAYLREHPEEILRLLKNAFGLRFGVPIDALRYLVRELGGGKKAPKDVVIEAAPPGIRVGLTVDAMGTPLRASLVVTIQEIRPAPSAIEIVLRISELSLKVLDDSSQSPLAGLIKSGALDLSKPGNLVAFMPKRPAVLVDAKDDRVTLDLMKVQKIAENPVVVRALAVVTPVLGVRALETNGDHLELRLAANLSGVPAAIAAVRA